MIQIIPKPEEECSLMITYYSVNLAFFELQMLTVSSQRMKALALNLPCPLAKDPIHYDRKLAHPVIVHLTLSML